MFSCFGEIVDVGFNFLESLKKIELKLLKILWIIFNRDTKLLNLSKLLHNFFSGFKQLIHVLLFKVIWILLLKNIT